MYLKTIQRFFKHTIAKKRTRITENFILKVDLLNLLTFFFIICNISTICEKDFKSLTMFCVKYKTTSIDIKVILSDNIAPSYQLLPQFFLTARCRICNSAAEKEKQKSHRSKGQQKHTLFYCFQYKVIVGTSEKRKFRRRLNSKNFHSFFISYF